MRDQTAGVILETWKLPYFKRELDGANFEFTEEAGISPGTVTLRVTFEPFRLDTLNQVIRTASKNAQAAKNQSKRVH